MLRTPPLYPSFSRAATPSPPMLSDARKPAAESSTRTTSSPSSIRGRMPARMAAASSAMVGACGDSRPVLGRGIVSVG